MNDKNETEFVRNCFLAIPMFSLYAEIQAMTSYHLRFTVVLLSNSDSF